MVVCQCKSSTRDEIQLARYEPGQLKVAPDLNDFDVQPVLVEQLLVSGIIEGHQDDVSRR
jgi:hypothetical protein